MRSLVIIPIAVATLLALPGAVGAQQPTQAQANAVKQACRADYQSRCAAVPPGGSAALQCLQQNAASLSSGCQQALGAIGGTAAPTTRGAAAAPPAPQPPQPAPALSPREQLAVLRADCGYDYRRLCAGVPPGGGRAIACLQSYGPQLSQPCRSALLRLRPGG